MIQKVLESINPFFQGVVVKGNQIGRQLGFPTANMDVQSAVNFPAINGVYSVIVYRNRERHYGVMNIGVKPTFDNPLRIKTYEVHILDFNQIIYGETLKVEICSFIRSERRFKNVELLKKQLHQDCKVARNQLNQNMQHNINLNKIGECCKEIDFDIVNYPDLEFVQYCQEKFRINRGLYNTIDKWFKENQIENIIQRRTTILQFLLWVTLYVPREEKMEFGAKGLSEQLNYYYINYVEA